MYEFRHGRFVPVCLLYKTSLTSVLCRAQNLRRLNQDEKQVDPQKKYGSKLLINVQAFSSRAKRTACYKDDPNRCRLTKNITGPLTRQSGSGSILGKVPQPSQFQLGGITTAQALSRQRPHQRLHQSGWQNVPGC
jgi:hypothetical protein